MNFKYLIICFAVLSLCSIYAYGKSCTSSNVHECSIENQKCLSQVMDDDQRSCECIFQFYDCLNNLGCDPRDPNYGGPTGSDPGNANGQYDMIRQSCVSFNCNPTGICDPNGSGQMLASLSVMAIAFLSFIFM